MDLPDYVRLLRRRWLWTAATLAGAVCAAVAWAHYGPATYTSSQTLFLVGSGQSSASTDAQLNSYAELLHSPAVIDPVQRQLGGDEPAADLSRRLTAEVKANTLILTVTAEDSSADGARSLAAWATRQLVALTSSLSTADEPGGRLVAADAAAPAVPTRNGPRTILLGALLGLLLGVVLALVREATDTRIHAADQMHRLGAADVPVVQLRGVPRIVADGDVPPGVRVLRTLLLRRARQDPTTYVISSCDERYPFDEIASSLALALARAEVNAVLISADLRPGRRTEVNGAQADLGLGEVLTAGSAVETLIRPGAHPRLWTLPPGRVVSHPEDALASNLMTNAVGSLRQTYDVVLIHTPPLGTGTDALAVADAARAAVVLTLAQGRTRRRQLRAALAALASAEVPVAAVALIPPWRPRPTPRRARVQRAPAPEPAGAAEPAGHARVPAAHAAGSASPAAAPPSQDEASSPAGTTPQPGKG